MISKIRRRTASIVRGEKGFTLIELMIVIAVLGILAGIAVPRLTGVQEDAKKAAAKSNLKTIQNSLEMFYINNGEEYPTQFSDADSDGKAFSDYVPSIDSSEYVFTNNATKSSYEIGIDVDEDTSTGNSNGYDLTLDPTGVTEH